ncbi:MAG: UDP-N-acetylglucosamine 2-epimerase (non-hydrolyzing) [Candidatus Aminicenantes bacterium]|nr:UDP-N-acetylglucosamine 2-epimerase (non-hydrolyzing) [Candidatus Aminicenantes bacterium]
MPKKIPAPKNLKLMLVAGARPNFMKIGPLLKAIDQHNHNLTSEEPLVETFFVHTGQHYDENMSGVFFKELGIRPPDVNLEVGSGSHTYQTATIMLRFEPICLEQKPDWVVVVGDVNSTLACSLVAAKLGIKIAHVEAGLRSYDRNMPEEINRLVTDTLADLLFTPSPDANLNLRKEGIPSKKIKLVGNIMIDALFSRLPEVENSDLPRKLKIRAKEFVYVTLHRPSNVDDLRNLNSIMFKLENLSKRFPVVFPVHPRTRKMLQEISFKPKSCPKLMLIKPLGYTDSLWLAKNASLVLTDSGGLQEETTFFRTPCLTLRENTERPVTITVGTNSLTSLKTLEADIKKILDGRYKSGAIPKYWDGKTAGRIVKYLVKEWKKERA